MAPESIQGRPADFRSDIFSFGCVLYEMISGKRAFAGESRLSIVAAILEKEPQPMSSSLSLTPPALEHVVLRCLMKDPEERWQSSRDLSRELKWISGGVGLTKESDPRHVAGNDLRGEWRLYASHCWPGSRSYPLAQHAVSRESASSSFAASTVLYFVRSLQFRYLA